MTNTLKSRIKKLSIARRNKISKRAKELIAEELTLRDLRKALALTQVDVSSRLRMNQEAISRLERRSDILLSTLASYIEAMGGKLSLTAKFPNRSAIRLKGFESVGQKK